MSTKYYLFIIASLAPVGLLLGLGDGSIASKWLFSMNLDFKKGYTFVKPFFTWCFARNLLRFNSVQENVRKREYSNETRMVHSSYFYH